MFDILRVGIIDMKKGYFSFSMICVMSIYSSIEIRKNIILMIRKV